ncbi:E3 ubiquitin-protein ligase ORTHRUS 2-like [Malania oleifera]|uniref:E3 ubiquitin-protein ligase ORTHRUS 2-like n=1 Tax=Malania oleifera TaxID=397392 RepID=UPI0025AEA0D3|nr:E3 ubiquitin-protein ligase ORTHRUS 2-like [Malania oleifera]
MAHDRQLPCDGNGICMICKEKPSPEDILACQTCATPWHVQCLSLLHPQMLADALQWECPDCCPLPIDPNLAPVCVEVESPSGELIAVIRVIESDRSLSEQEKARKRQHLVSGGLGSLEIEKEERKNKSNEILDIFRENLNCSFCMQMLERPVTIPCGHNFCLRCFKRWIGQGKHNCANCRAEIPTKIATQPRINSMLVIAIRMAKQSKSTTTPGPQSVIHHVVNQNRPDKAYTTERAKKPGKANACSGKIFVTVPPDHFGPILAENDPTRNQGVLVGESWDCRLDCRQWGVHRPPVGGIAGQSNYGAQSVVLSGGYEDDEDHGEWFLYTGSGGRDLSGNKRTNKEQTSDQGFGRFNEALRVSCREGYPVRVLRSHKVKHSSYAPERGFRYDGIYRIEKCWQKVGMQGFKMCRYLFVRCDNEPAPWTSDEHGDRPRPLPEIDDLKGETDITERKGNPSWDYDEEKCCWMWKRTPPHSRRQVDGGNSGKRKRTKPEYIAQDKLLKEFSCYICRKVMTLPLTTPCAHNFCKGCLEGVFAGQTFMRQRTCEGRRTLRAQKNIMKCPSCSNDISDFLTNPQVNRELMGVIESLQRRVEVEKETVESSGDGADSMDESSDEIMGEG